MSEGGERERNAARYGLEPRSENDYSSMGITF